MRYINLKVHSIEKLVVGGQQVALVVTRVDLTGTEGGSTSNESSCQTRPSSSLARPIGVCQLFEIVAPNHDIDPDLSHFLDACTKFR